MMIADDVQILYDCSIDDIENGISIVNGELKNIARFCNDYGIEINASKSKVLIIYKKKCLNKVELWRIAELWNKWICWRCARFWLLNKSCKKKTETHIKNIQQKVYGALNTHKLLPADIKLQLIRSL